MNLQDVEVASERAPTREEMMVLIGDARQTTVHLYTEREGVREPVLPPVDFAVPRDELESDTPTTKRPVLAEATRSGERRRIMRD